MKKLFYLPLIVLTIPVNAQQNMYKNIAGLYESKVETIVSKDRQVNYDDYYGVVEYIDWVDLPNGQKISKKTLSEKYGKRFAEDAYKLQLTVTNPISKARLAENIMHRIQNIERERKSFDKIRTRLTRIRNTGITLATLSGTVCIAVPILAQSKAVNVENPQKITIATSAVCGACFISGMACIWYFMNNRYLYDPGFSIADGLYIRDNGLGVSVTKTF